MVGIGRVQRRARSAPFDSAVFNEREASSGGLAAGADRELGSARPAAGGLPRSGARRPTLQRLPLASIRPGAGLSRSTGAREPALLQSLELAAAHLYYGAEPDPLRSDASGGRADVSEVP